MKFYSLSIFDTYTEKGDREYDSNLLTELYYDINLQNAVSCKWICEYNYSCLQLGHTE